MNGIQIPPVCVSDRIDNGAGDLALNLLFFSATQSLRIREWRFIGVDGFDQTFAVGQVSQRAVDLLNQGWANAFATLDNSWSMINLISVQPPQLQDKFIRIPLPENFRDRIKERLQKGDCNSFLAKLFAKAAEYTRLKNGDVVKRSSLENDTTGGETPYAVDGLDALEKINDFVLDDNLFAAGSVDGSIPNKNATVLLNTKMRYQSSNKRYVNRVTNAAYQAYISTAIHEIAHLAGKQFDDHVLAQAGRDLGETTKPVSLNINKGTVNASAVVSDIINKHCGEGVK